MEQRDGAMNTKLFEELPVEAIAIRKEVFIEEQGFQMEFDEIDRIAKHLVMYNDEEPIATCRFFFDKEKSAFFVGRIAVIKKYRGMKFGALILQEAEKMIQQKEEKKIMLFAQCRVQAFYEKQGYKKEGEPYLDEGCPHILMSKII